jgi:transposase
MRFFPICLKRDTCGTAHPHDTGGAVMFGTFEDARIFIFAGATDFRKHIDGLAEIVAASQRGTLYEGDLFVFCSKGRDKLKVLYYDRNGFCIWYKRLEAGKFPWPKTAAEAQEITKEQMMWLLRGIDFWHEHKKITHFHV